MTTQYLNTICLAKTCLSKASMEMRGKEANRRVKSQGSPTSSLQRCSKNKVGKFIVGASCVLNVDHRFVIAL